MKNLSFIGYDAYAVCKSGKIYSIRSAKFLTPVVQRSGYCHVTLSQNGRKNNYLVHRLVALAFLENLECKPTVNHKDGNKQNNAHSNLEWATQQEQIHHALEIGLMSGTRNPDRSLTDEQAHMVCKYIEDSWRNTDISKLLNIPQQVVANIRFGTDYQDVSCEYDFSKTLPSRRKISVEKLIEVCELLQDGRLKQFEIAQRVGVSSACVSTIKHRKHGVYISKNYDF